jgi:membrane protein YqaA with SNARE-associated domain
VADFVSDGRPDGRSGTTISGFLARYGVLLCFVWGFAEATLFFVVPDVMVGAVALFWPRRWWRAAAAALIGALAGAAVLAILTSVFGERVRDVVVAVPGVSLGMMRDVAREVKDIGPRAMLGGPVAGVPFKVYVVESVLASAGAVSLFAWSIVGRASRIVLVAGIAALVGAVLRRPIHTHQRMFLSVYVVWWVVTYAVFFSIVR